MKKLIYILTASIFISCSSNDNLITFIPKDPKLAEIAEVDRFGEFGTLFKRTIDNTLPDANKAIDFDKAPFITEGLDADGKLVKYYNFDVQPEYAAPIYVLFKAGDLNPVANQLNIIDLIPGDADYNDFWRMYKVTVPDNYVANSVTSVAEIYEYNFSIEILDDIVNCPVVPKGSTAKYHYNNQENNKLDSGWYKGKIVYYFTFNEKSLTVSSFGSIPTSPIYVTFNLNPDENNPLSGPYSGNFTEQGTNQTHNILETIPTDDLYSPFWSVNVYDNFYFSQINDLTTAQSIPLLAENAMLVNCPVIYTD